VRAILASRCSSCHGGAKPDARLRVDSVDALLRGGSSGPAVVLGAPHRGTLLARVRAPIDDPDHMPPDGEPQLTEAEIALLVAWVAAPRALGPETGAAPSASAADDAPSQAPATEPAAPGEVGQGPPDGTGDTRGAAPAPSATSPEAGGSAATDATAGLTGPPLRGRRAVPATAPGRAGCASCAVGSTGGPANGAVAVAGALLALLRARRVRRRASRSHQPHTAGDTTATPPAG
jgi:MYXO-CTERM domain-containing protein